MQLCMTLMQRKKDAMHCAATHLNKGTGHVGLDGPVGLHLGLLCVLQVDRVKVLLQQQSIVIARVQCVPVLAWATQQSGSIHLHACAIRINQRVANIASV
jgi:hypothetical protein